LILSLFLLIVTISCGHIRSWGHQLTYDSLGKMNSIILNFKLGRGLPSGNYILLTFPFNLGTVALNNLPTAKIYQFNNESS